MSTKRINNLTATILAALALVFTGCDRINPFTDGPELLTGPADINVRINSAGVADGATVAIPDTSIGTTRTRTITIQNRGAEDLLIGGATISDDAAGAFSLDTSGMELTVTSGEQTTFEASFSPLAVGTYTATLTITSNDTDEAAYEIYFTGSGVDTSECDIEIYQAAAHIPDGAGSYDFGEQTVGSNTTVAFTVSNTGGADLTVTSVALSGTDAGQFYSPGMNTTIAGGADADFTVEFNPTAEGDYTATVTVTSDDADEGEYTFTLTGTGTAVASPEITVSVGNGIEPPTPIANNGTYDIGELVVGSYGSAFFTIENTGNANLNIENVTSDQGTLGWTPDYELGQNETVDFSVTFNPSTTGDITATINITSNDSDEDPYTIAVTGVGINPEIDVAWHGTNIANGDPFTFADSFIDDSGVTETFTIRNLGQGDLTISDIVLDTTYFFQYSLNTTGTSYTVAAGGQTTFSVKFIPCNDSDQPATVTITSNDSDETVYYLYLHGKGYNYTCYVYESSVNAADDASHGSSVDTPYKTITYAVANAGPNAIIRVIPGTYSTTNNGETFPITLQTGQKLVGDPAWNGKGGTPLIVDCNNDGSGGIGSSSSCFVMGSGSSVQGFDFINSAGALNVFGIFASGCDFDTSYNTFENSMYGAVYCNGGNMTSRSNNIYTNYFGYYIMSADSALIYSNSLSTDMYTPINIETGNPSIIISGNKIQGNGQVGIQVISGNPVILGNEFPNSIEYTLAAVWCSGGSPTLRNNSFSTLNGVLISGTGQPNLGTAESPGNNEFTGCTTYGVNVTSGYEMTIYAIGNTWSGGSTTPANGNDIIVDNSTQKVIYGTGSSDYETGL